MIATRRFVCVVSALGFTLLIPACTRMGSSVATKTETVVEKQQVDPWPEAVTELRKQNDIGTCRRALTQLNVGLNENPSAERPPELPAAAATALADSLRLTPEELAEVTSKTYTPLDSAYLNDAFYLRDTVRSLDVGSLPPERQATILFQWVCRQVYLHDWNLSRPGQPVQIGPTIPPTYILRRGYGSGLERAMVYLALLQQAGIEGALIGTPGHEQASSRPVVNGKIEKGPFWAVGARFGDDLFLFDPWRGEALPGAKPGVPATMASLKSNPQTLNSWYDNKAKPWDVPKESLAKATAYVTMPLSAASTRIKLLDSRLSTETNVRLAIDLKSLVESISKAAGDKALVWAPPARIDPFAYTRVLRTFLPAEEGGADKTPFGPSRLYERASITDLLPIGMFVPPAELNRAGMEAMQNLSGIFFNQFKNGFIDSALREKIHRGLFNDVISQVVRLETNYAISQQRYRTDPQHAQLVRMWCQTANQIYEDLGIARLPENRAKLSSAEAEVAKFWGDKELISAQTAVIDQSVAASGLAESAYVLALCKHEQAERLEIRKDRSEGPARERAQEAAKSAWLAAKDSWDRYNTYLAGQEKAFPGRGEHARTLTTRATEKSEGK